MKHYIPEKYIHLRAEPFWEGSTLPEEFSRRYHTGAHNYVRLSVMQGSIKYACFSDEKTLMPSRERVIQAGNFEVFAPDSWHTIEILSDEASFNLDIFGLNKG